MWDHAECRDPSSKPGAIQGGNNELRSKAMTNSLGGCGYTAGRLTPINRLQPSAAGAILSRRG